MSERQTLGETVGRDRVLELLSQYVEQLPDDADPNAVDFRREVTMKLAREAGDGPEGWFAYVCLHFFTWRDQMYCRICGSPVLPGWMAQHKDQMHSPHF